jgi:glutamine amidotransferase
MTSRVAIIDYGMGNLHSVQNAVRHLGFTSDIISDPENLSKYRKIILPGVGAFGQAIARLRDSGMAMSLNEEKESGAEILGICLGMQLMCSQSEEEGLHQGLDWFDAEVREFDRSYGLPIPHMGWNAVVFHREDPILQDIPSGEDAYFVHSFYVACKSEADVLATTEYGLPFASMIQKENLRGIQFHPEKSQEFGLRMLRNYLEMPC